MIDLLVKIVLVIVDVPLLLFFSSRTNKLDLWNFELSIKASTKKVLSTKYMYRSGPVTATLSFLHIHLTV